MKLEWLQYFSEAVKYRSISVAAENNFISQSSFSASISKLEKELGVELLHRTNQGVSPTETGKLVLQKCDIIFGALDDLEDEVAGANAVGTVKILSLPLFYNYLIPQIVVKAREIDLPFQIEAQTGDTGEIISSVSSGLADFGVIFNNEEKLTHAVTYKPLFKETFVVFVGKKSSCWNAKCMTLAQVEQEPYAAFRGEFSGKNDDVWTEAISANIHPNVMFRTDELDLLKKVIAQGDYLAFFPMFMSLQDTYLCDGSIRAIPISDNLPELEVGYICGSYNKLSSSSKRFITMMESTVQEYMETSCIQ